jgi:hypothetical protein
LYLWWIDSSGDTTSAVFLSDSLGYIRNGDDQWDIYGPLDLSNVDSLYWDDDEASEVWMSFRWPKPTGGGIAKPVGIRVGWIRLTE